MYRMEGFVGGIFGTFNFSTKDELVAFMIGAEHALYTFAHWKDGVMYVGISGKTYKEAIQELRDQYKQATGEDYDEE